MVLVVLTPCEWRYSAVLVIVCSTALASLSEKNFCLRIRSSSSPPRISSVTMNTCLPLSYTCDRKTNKHQRVLLHSTPKANKSCQTECVFRPTSLSVMMLGCCPYLSRISISSEGSVLVLSIIWKSKAQQRH